MGDGAPEMATSLEPKQNIKTAIQVSEITPLRQVLAFVPLILVGVMNKFFYSMDPDMVSKRF